jgi:hypothetical protein
MNKAEFEEKYAKKSGMTVKQLHENKLVVIECHCHEPGCHGWQMTHEKEVLDFYNPTLDDGITFP